jgi:RND superfamily putative drug exporter
MVFRLIGWAVRRAWIVLLVGWGVLLFATWRAAPPWRAVARDREFAFLPADAPSRHAEEVYATAFPDDPQTSNVVLVLHRESGGDGTLTGDLKFIEDVLEPGLRKIAESEGGLASAPAPSEEPLFATDEPAKAPAPPAKHSIIDRIRTPNAPGTGAFLISPDHRALLVVVELTTEFLSDANWPAITKIENLMHELRESGKLPDGLEMAITGSAVIGRDHNVAQLQSVRATETLTVVLVIVLLLLIYRAPLLAIIPLVAVALSIQISLSILAILAGAGHLLLFEGIQIYITILSYGAGVDYCLFLTARYREELCRGVSPTDAVVDAIRHTGPALAASAAAVICGIGTMYFARFGKFSEAGLAIPLSLFLVLCATLTFTPSLLRVAGQWAFWPWRPETTPGCTPSAAAPQLAEGAEPMITSGLWDRMGRLLIRRAGTVWLVAVALMAPFAVVACIFYNYLSYDVVGSLPADAPGVTGTRILQEHFPAGVMGPITVLLIDPKIDFSGPQGREIIARLTDQLRAREQELDLADVRSLTAPFGNESATAKPFAGLNLPEDVVRKATARGSLDHYVTDLGERAKVGTRLDLILSVSPFAQQSIDALDRIEAAVREGLPDLAARGGHLHFVGTTASVRDLSAVIRADRIRIQILVLVSVFAILVILLRGLVSPVYLLLTVLFSYLTTLGVCFAVFWLLDRHGFSGIDWKVAIFLFTILIAVGADYNIFLMTRIHEEERRHGPILGITQALDRTGPIISSCGIIMAGTFASLMAGSLTEMKQLGFALAFGVLLDTFVVRPILVPAFFILWRSGKLFPAARSRAGGQSFGGSLFGGPRSNPNAPRPLR